MSVPRTRIGCTPSATTSMSWPWIQRRLRKWNPRYWWGFLSREPLLSSPGAVEGSGSCVLQLHPYGALPLSCAYFLSPEMISAWFSLVPDSVKNWSSVLYIVSHSGKLRGLDLPQYQFYVSFYQAPLKCICWRLGFLEQASSLLPSVYMFLSLGLIFIVPMFVVCGNSLMPLQRYCLVSSE